MRMLPITSLQNPTVKLVKSLSDKKGRREAGLFMAEGMAMLERAADLGWEPIHFIATKPVIIWDGVRPLLVSEKIMGELSAQNNPHDVLATFKQQFQPHPGKSGIWLALEDIRDPGNLGTIMRTADAANATGIILIGECCDPYSPECVRASTGSVFALPVVRMKADGFADYAKAFPGDVVGLAMTAKSDFRQGYGADVLLVLGSESRGLSQDVSNACKTLVRIPMKPGVESLNVATAAALIVYQVIKP
jgi:RNA methyltransferase, TrmH family